MPMLPGALLDEAELRNTAAADADTGSLAQPADDAMAVTATSTIGTSFRTEPGEPLDAPWWGNW